MKFWKRIKELIRPPKEIVIEKEEKVIPLPNIDKVVELKPSHNKLLRFMSKDYSGRIKENEVGHIIRVVNNRQAKRILNDLWHSGMIDKTESNDYDYSINQKGKQYIESNFKSGVS